LDFTTHETRDNDSSFIPASRLTVDYKQLAFKSEDFIPSRVEVFPLDVGRQRVFFVGQQRDFDVRVGRATEVLGSESFCLDDLHRQSLFVEVVRHAELDAPELLGAQRRVVRLLDVDLGGLLGRGLRLAGGSADLQQCLVERRTLVGRRYGR